jgi:DnaK suppressor protein
MLRENSVVAPQSATERSQKHKLSQREAQLYDLLEKQRDGLTSKLEAQASDMVQGIFVEGDYADRASKVARQSKRLAMERLWQNMRDEVVRALARLEQGTYGVCVRCGVGIPEERLFAMPSAANCIECARLQGQRAAN